MEEDDPEVHVIHAGGLLLQLFHAWHGHGHGHGHGDDDDGVMDMDMVMMTTMMIHTYSRSRGPIYEHFVHLQPIKKWIVG